MALSTGQLRSAWAPACRSKGNVYHAAYAALDACFRKHGYRVRGGVTGAYSCRPITGGSGYSLHAYGPGSSFRFWTGVSIATSLAVDINTDKNPYGPRLITDMPRAMINDITSLRTKNGAQVWGWGGYYSNNKDAMHFEIVCSPRDLATGISGTSGGSTQEDINIVDANTKTYFEGKFFAMAALFSKVFKGLKGQDTRITKLQRGQRALAQKLGLDPDAFEKDITTKTGLNEPEDPEGLDELLKALRD